MAENRNKTETVQRVAWGRRFLAATVVVPPSISELLNTDAMAVLAVIRNDAAATGKCTLPVARIAERANVGRAKVRAAIKLAERLEIIAIEIAPDRRRVIINRCVTSRNSLRRSSSQMGSCGMSGAGHERRFRDLRGTSAYPPRVAAKADIPDRQVRAISGYE